MPLIADRPAQLLWDKMADTWDDVHAVEVRLEDFVEVVSDTDDTDVETDLLPAAEIVDANLAEGLGFSDKVTALLGAFLGHVREVGGHSSLTPYFTAQRWRADEYTAIGCWEDSRLGSALSRLCVCPQATDICSHIQGTGYTDIGDIVAEAGPGRLRVEVDGKGALIWTPDIHAVCEGPATVLVGGITAADVTVTVASTTDFPATGHILIGSEAIAYAGKGATTFTGCTRAQYNTGAAVHNTGAAVYKVHTYTPAIRAAAVTGLLLDLDFALADDTSEAGGTAFESTGIGGGTPDWQVGNLVLLKDHTCPELMTQDCNAADDHVHVADTSAFKAGDYVILYDDTVDTEYANILSVDDHDKIIYLDAGVANTYTVALSGLICLMYSTINEGAPFTAADLTLTVAVGTCAALPATGTLLIDDEEIGFTAVGGGAGEDITIPAGATGRGANGTVATAHEDLVPVVLIQEGTFPGHNEWHTITAVNANDLALAPALIHTYHLAGFIVPLLRDVVLVEDGASGTPGDDFTIVAAPDRLIHKAG